ncbi:methionyl-tRNA formyltransferase [Natroniella sulfidigena]|uniref:methionyl-tRNA formyltransferase n=1 Tax=Natroniella sulfidigena TaxID=723921 RepID=UPI00200ABEEE|nr:methionyl-tRNA formyltransferase [Natroniella sulfidigena]MCK8817822.1 methionyl-tRNA formyltransferase [Natroniella sulfidigena]
MDIVFMGTPDFAVPALEAVVEAEGIEVQGVISQPDRKKGRGQKLQPTSVKKKALEYDLEVFQPEDISEGIDKLKEWDPEVIAVVAYGQILPEEVLNLPEHGCINVHSSLLPKYRGAAPIHRAIINGDQITGVTTMKLEQGMDTGDMILQQEVEITAEDTVGSLHDRLALVGGELLVETLVAIADGSVSYQEQDHAAATYADKVDKKEGEVDWGQSAEDIWNLIRGFNPWPGAYTYYQGQRLKLWASQVVDQEKVNEKIEPGTIVELDHDLGIVVQTGQGQLVLTKLQPASKQKMSATDYLLGYDIEVGSKLGD